MTATRPSDQPLSADARAVLATLPPVRGLTPGTYVGDIAKDLIGQSDSKARARIRALLHEIDLKLGRLGRHHARGPVPYGHRVSYTVPTALWPKVEAMLDKGYALTLSPEKVSARDRLQSSRAQRRRGARAAPKGSRSPEAPTISNEASSREPA